MGPYRTPPDPTLHPRPLLRREHWRSLDGTWEFAFDADARHHDPSTVAFDRVIQVPFAPECRASGLGDSGFHRAMWYRRVVELAPEEKRARLLLHFGAVDYEAKVWVNGQLVVEHTGGSTPFSADITEARRGCERIEIVVRADDDPFDLAKPRGKQDWLAEPHDIWYPRTSGIWQTVWLEPVAATSVHRLVWTPHLDHWQVGLDAGFAGPIEPGMTLNVKMRLGDDLIVDDRYGIHGVEMTRRIGLTDPGIDDRRNHLLWRPNHPVLLDVELTLYERDQVVDRVWSYTALRSAGVQGNRFMLNGRPFYLKMVLDQGYWPDTHLTPPSAEALRRDVELTLALGFNGARKHQKLEDPRYLYWCDRLGLLVWSEMPSPYRFTRRAVDRLVSEWTEALRRDLSHPSVVAWVPLNESWGVPDLSTNPAHRDYVRALYHLTKTIDPTRPVVGNDGWEHVATDLVTIHDYASSPKILRERYGTPESVQLVLERQEPGGRPLLMVPGFAASERPVILSEFGGITLPTSDGPSWGYSKVQTSEALGDLYAGLLGAVHDCRGLAGFCYTQLTDTFQEQNGLLTPDRRPKVEIEKLAAATRGRRKAFAMDVDPEPFPT